MSDQVFIAQVLLVVAAPDEDVAAEGIGEMLRYQMHGRGLLDWAFIKTGATSYSYPILTDLTVDQGEDEDVGKQSAYEKALPGYEADQAPLSPWQITFAQTYAEGDFADCKTLADVRAAAEGDTGYLAAMLELDKKEGCEDAEMAVSRLDSMIEELTAARDAILAG